MKRLVRGAVGVAVVTVLAGCTVGGGDGGEGAASCAYIALYDGRRYFGYGAGDFELGERLGTAVLPSCDDTGGYPDDPGVPERRVPAYAIKGIDPTVAITTGTDSPDTVLVADGAGETLPPEVREVVRVGE
ncbi:DUF6281 family protein [Streptomyces sp. NPDC096205]|uniref:DUF6281 family protein n=1 Tax=Streptomyces sp. NPDC096205 TaxID=3366081 RepID=UPI00380ABE02